MEYPHLIGMQENTTIEDITNHVIEEVIRSIFIFFVPNFILTGIFMFYRAINPILFFVENAGCMILTIYFAVYSCKSGLYLDEEGIYIQGIRKKRIEAKDVKGIKVTKYAIRKFKNDFLGAEYFTPMQDENGEYIYCMVLLNSVYSTMRTYNEEHISFCGKFEGCVIGMTGYDLPAINRLRELNPDLIVMYEE